VHRIYVDRNGQGRLPEKLMGPDHCLLRVSNRKVASQVIALPNSKCM